jgi:disulfide bond formation protein DsbB
VKDGGYQVRNQPLTNLTAITMPILGTIWFCRMLNQVLAIATIVDLLFQIAIGIRHCEKKVVRRQQLLHAVSIFNVSPNGKLCLPL